MEPNPRLTYLDRVVTEIIETEQLYVGDLRMIVEVHLFDSSYSVLFLNFPLSLIERLMDPYDFVMCYSIKAKI